VPTPAPDDDSKAGWAFYEDPIVLSVVAAVVVLVCFVCLWRRRRAAKAEDPPQREMVHPQSRADPSEVVLEEEEEEEAGQQRRFVDDSEFADWDYSSGGEPPSQAHHHGSTLESYAQRRSGRLVTLDSTNRVAHVRWLENDPFAHALVRRLCAVREDDGAPPASGLKEGEDLSLVPAVEGFEVSVSDDEQSSAITRADVWPFEQRRQAVTTLLGKLRVPHAAGRVELKVRREDCYAGAFKAYKKLSSRAWRMAWFVKFHQESGLDAGGLSREFWRLTLRGAFAEEKALFARAADGSYDVVDAAPDEIRDRLAEYRFVGRALAKLLFDTHSGCLEAPLNVKILKLLVGEPVVFDDLQLIDEELWGSLTKLEALANQDHRLDDLCLTFAVDRISRLSGKLENVDLEPNGSETVVDARNLDRFLEARMREAVFEKHRAQLLALVAGFHDICPPATLLLLTARELELALCGESHLDLHDWKANTDYRGAFETLQADHPVCRAFWATVDAWDDEKRTRLLQWSVGTARLPLGGFAHLQQRDGVARKFTLTSVPAATAIYPRSHTCFNRIDLPLYANPDRDVPPALDFVVTHATAEFTLD